MIAQLLADAATSYVLHNGRRPPTDPLPPVTFVVVDVETAPRTFHELFKLETVPHLFFFPVRHDQNDLWAINLDEWMDGWTDHRI